MAHHFNTQFPAARGVEMNLQKQWCTTNSNRKRSSYVKEQLLSM